jgi:hypothetical protein
MIPHSADLTKVIVYFLGGAIEGMLPFAMSTLWLVNVPRELADNGQ